MAVPAECQAKKMFLHEKENISSLLRESGKPLQKLCFLAACPAITLNTPDRIGCLRVGLAYLFDFYVHFIGVSVCQ